MTAVPVFSWQLYDESSPWRRAKIDALIHDIAQCWSDPLDWLPLDIAPKPITTTTTTASHGLHAQGFRPQNWSLQFLGQLRHLALKTKGRLDTVHSCMFKVVSERYSGEGPFADPARYPHLMMEDLEKVERELDMVDAAERMNEATETTRTVMDPASKSSEQSRDASVDGQQEDKNKSVKTEGNKSTKTETDKHKDTGTDKSKNAETEKSKKAENDKSKKTETSKSNENETDKSKKAEPPKPTVSTAERHQALITGIGKNWGTTSKDWIPRDLFPTQPHNKSQKLEDPMQWTIALLHALYTLSLRTKQNLTLAHLVMKEHVLQKTNGILRPLKAADIPRSSVMQPILDRLQKKLDRKNAAMSAAEKAKSGTSAMGHAKATRPDTKNATNTAGHDLTADGTASDVFVPKKQQKPGVNMMRVETPDITSTSKRSTPVTTEATTSSKPHLTVPDVRSISDMYKPLWDYRQVLDSPVDDSRVTNDSAANNIGPERRDSHDAQMSRKMLREQATSAGDQSLFVQENGFDHHPDDGARQPDQKTAALTVQMKAPEATDGLLKDAALTPTISAHGDSKDNSRLFKTFTTLSSDGGTSPTSESMDVDRSEQQRHSPTITDGDVRQIQQRGKILERMLQPSPSSTTDFDLEQSKTGDCTASADVEQGTSAVHDARRSRNTSANADSNALPVEHEYPAHRTSSEQLARKRKIQRERVCSPEMDNDAPYPVENSDRGRPDGDRNSHAPRHSAAELNAHKRVRVMERYDERNPPNSIYKDRLTGRPISRTSLQLDSEQYDDSPTPFHQGEEHKAQQGANATVRLHRASELHPDPHRQGAVTPHAHGDWTAVRRLEDEIEDLKQTILERDLHVKELEAKAVRLEEQVRGKDRQIASLRRGSMR